MIKANELRIGNWYDNNGVYKQVTPHVIESLFESTERLWIKPIHLSPEILEKCGFENYQEFNSYFDENGLWILNGIVILQSYLTAKFHYSYLANDDDSLSMGLEIKSLYQLQNLYYALTGEELTFKP